MPISVSDRSLFKTDRILSCISFCGGTISFFGITGFGSFFLSSFILAFIAKL